MDIGQHILYHMHSLNYYRLLALDLAYVLPYYVATGRSEE